MTQTQGKWIVVEIGNKMKIKTDKNFLHKECKPIKKGEISFLVQKMFLEIKKRENSCYGIALNQLGISKRGFVTNKKGVFKYYINPKVLEFNGIEFENKNEGCLSLNKRYNVKRFDKITVTDTRNGKQILKGNEAVIFQHEFNHINGKLISDK